MTRYAKIRELGRIALSGYAYTNWHFM